MECTVLLKSEQHEDERVNQARINHGLQNVDVILVSEAGYVTSLRRLGVVNNDMGTSYTDINEAAAAYEVYINNPSETDNDYKAYYNGMQEVITSE